MSTLFKYMKAATIDPKKDMDKIRFPVWASPKIDGFRASVQGSVCLTSSLVPFPNRYLNSIFNGEKLNGVDGEMVSGCCTGNDVYARTSSAVTSRDGEPVLTLYVFDYVPAPTCMTAPYRERHLRLQALVNACRKEFSIALVNQTLIKDISGLNFYLAKKLDEGYEGAMLRGYDSGYKQGRSSLVQQWLMKLKPFVDSEAVILDVEEARTNTNEEGNRPGRRRSLKAGMVPKGTLGKFVVRDLYSGVEFKVGTGTLKHEVAQQLWDARHTKAGKLQGRIIKYKYQAVGIVNAPRQPIFMGWREKFDIG